jgi:hypothetical protein
VLALIFQMNPLQGWIFFLGFNLCPPASLTNGNVSGLSPTADGKLAPIFKSRHVALPASGRRVVGLYR